VFATLLGGQAMGGSPASAAATCGSLTGAGYTVAVCLDPSPDGTTLTGANQVTATVTVTPAGAVAVDRVTFLWNGGYLLADHDPDSSASPVYRMTLRSERLANGASSPAVGTLSARATVVEADGTPRGTSDSTASVTVTNPTGLPPVEPFTVRTAGPGPDGRVRLAAVGDGVDGSPLSQAVANQIDAWDPDVFAYLGDVYDRGTPQELDTWYGDAAGYGRFRYITNPTVGNHEYMTSATAAPYFDYWGQVPHYYSYDVGGWHVVVLDSTTEFAQVAAGTPQYDWLSADLTAHQGTCTLAYMHHPRFSNVLGVGRDGLRPVWELLTDKNVTMVLAGHAHTYERWTPMDRTGAAAAGGITAFVVGTGGREIMNPKGDDPRVAAQTTLPAAGALRLDLGPDDAAFSFASTDGTFTDSGTIPCRKPPPPPDITGPTTPTATARATAPTAATISWSPSTDGTGVAGYTIRRGGAVVATVGGGSTSYPDTRLRGGTAYTWTVDAFDAAGNRSAPSAPVSATTPLPMVASRALLRQLRTAAEHRRGWSTTRFPGWTDADGDGCSTRAEVLLAEAVVTPVVRSRCTVSGGRWFSPYDGVSTTRSARLTVDHLVPLRETWESGAYRWKLLSRRQLANDLGYVNSLLAVSTVSARAKADAESPSWLPTRRAFRCTYLARWVAVKWRWQLAVDADERAFLTRRLKTCGWPSVVQPTRPVIRRTAG
jgi:hypothetical protein